MKCDPGEFWCHVSEIALHDRKPAPSLPLASNVGIARENMTVSQVPKKAIPLFPKADDDKSKESKCDVEKPAATESSKPKVSLEETKDPEKHEVDVGGTDDDESDEDFVDSEEGESDDDENSSDGDECESSNEEDEDSPNSAKGKNRPAATPLKTPPGKKARTTTSSMGKRPVSVSDDAKKSIHVTGYGCKSCSKFLYQNFSQLDAVVHSDTWASNSLQGEAQCSKVK
ncbi:uncharacterized protein [Zea mays]|nr:histone deacetylase HDT2-like isoform X1 [Zea mays]XP_035823576.1 uncharacterized protein LOC100193092 isoform X1 [Zea mays]